MAMRLWVLAVLAAVTLTSAAAAGPAATKQRVGIEMKFAPGSTFVLTPLQAGSLKDDSGRITNVQAVLGRLKGRRVVRDGMDVTIYGPDVWVLQGKRGTLVLRERSEWVDLGDDTNGDGELDGIGFGTWKLVRGTGQYAHLTGSGRSGHEGLGRVWIARHEGYVATRS
jgi:hypothetical protein